MLANESTQRPHMTRNLVNAEAVPGSLIATTFTGGCRLPPQSAKRGGVVQVLVVQSEKPVQSVQCKSVST
jgi:hypothetical protein